MIPGNTRSDRQADGPSSEEESLLQLHRELGWRVIFEGGFCWLSSGLRMFVPLPCTGPISLSNATRRALWEQHALFLRYPCDDDHPSYPSHIHMVSNKDYDIMTLALKRRNNVRRGLRDCSIDRTTFDYLVRNGLPLIRDTYDRQGRVCTEHTIELWRKYFTAAGRNPLFEAWGAFFNNQLAAFCVNFTFRGVVNVYCSFSRRDLLRYRQINALIFVCTKDAITRAEVNHVSYGMRATVGDPESLKSFKDSLGFRKIPVNERIEVNPWLKPLFDLGGARLIRSVSKMFQNRSAKAQLLIGMISTYLNQRQNAVAGSRQGSVQ